MNYEKLFKYMSDEHGITLLETEMQEICKIVFEMQGDELQKNDVISSLPTKKYEIDFGGNILAGLEITNNKPTVIGAMNGWGDSISKDDITITEK